MTGPARIVVTVGTDHHPFDRLVGWIDTWAAAHPDVAVLLQRGTTRRPVTAANVHAVDLLAWDELTAAMAAADAVVAQGGPGGIMDARSVGHRPLVVARRHDLGEHVDDHQVRFTRWLAERGTIDLVEHEEELAARLDAALADPATQRIEADADGGSDPAVARFRAVVDPLLRSRRRRAAHPQEASR